MYAATGIDAPKPLSLACSVACVQARAVMNARAYYFRAMRRHELVLASQTARVDVSKPPLLGCLAAGVVGSATSPTLGAGLSAPLSRLPHPQKAWVVQGAVGWQTHDGALPHRLECRAVPGPANDEAHSLQLQGEGRENDQQCSDGLDGHKQLPIRWHGIRQASIRSRVDSNGDHTQR